jgi:hypothetical protein
MTATIQEIERQLETMPLETQQQVLSYIKTLPHPTLKGVEGKTLRPFFGILSDEDANEMMKAIEEGCERVDLNEW